VKSNKNPSESKIGKTVFNIVKSNKNPSESKTIFKNCCYINTFFHGIAIGSKTGTSSYNKNYEIINTIFLFYGEHKHGGLLGIMKKGVVGDKIDVSYTLEIFINVFLLRNQTILFTASPPTPQKRSQPPKITTYAKGIIIALSMNNKSGFRTTTLTVFRFRLPVFSSLFDHKFTIR